MEGDGKGYYRLPQAVSDNKYKLRSHDFSQCNLHCDTSCDLHFWDLQDSTTGASNWLFWFTFWHQKVWTRMWRVLCVNSYGWVILQSVPIDDGWSWFLRIVLLWGVWSPKCFIEMKPRLTRPGCLSEPLNQLILVACIKSCFLLRILVKYITTDLLSFGICG